jgi:methylenetetrahydrofolate dehydrogenase (NADP+)/methenyltetrahydrofolate cyclohydrolase
MAQLLTGKEVTQALNRDLLLRSERLKAAGISPTLGIIRLGERPDDLAYERGATKRAEKTGVTVRKFQFPEDMTQEALCAEIKKINADDSIHGVLLFRPLPKQMNDDAVRNTLAPEKDIDGITDVSMAGVYSGADLGFPPCTAEACMEILDYYQVDLKGKTAAVIGRSTVIGRPVAMMLMKRNATVTVCHTKTEHMAEVCRDKDIIIAAAGHVGTVTGAFVRPGQTVIDVAINFTKDGKMCGDTVFEEVAPVVASITPVPGGVGTVTTSMLMKHVIEAAEKTVK